MLILLPPSESKANRRRGRPADAATWSFPELAPTRERVAAALAEVSRSPDAAALLGVSDGTARRGGAQPRARHAPATPAAEVYTGVLYDALDLGLARHRRPPPREPLARRRLGAARRGAPGRPDHRLPAVDGRDAARARPAGPGVATRARPGAARPSPAVASSSTAGRRRMPPRGARAPTSPPAGCRSACPGPATWPSTPAGSWPGTCARWASPRGRCRRSPTSWPGPSRPTSTRPCALGRPLGASTRSRHDASSNGCLGVVLCG